MAVTLTIEELQAALRLGDSAEETAEVTRLHAYASEAVTRHAPQASDTAMNEAVRRLTGYLFDQPEAGRGMAYANALRNSGAAGMLLPYRIHGLGYGDAVEAAQAAVGTVGNPVIGLAINDGKLVVTFADGSTAELDLPAGMVVGDGTDQTARADATAALEAARTAQETADANALAQAGHDGNANAHHVPPMGGGGVVSESTRLPLGTVVMRLGWAQTQTPAEAIFTRADLHPTDGAAEGTVAGLSVPPFPPGLDTDPSLYLFIWIATAAANIADIRLSGGGGTLVGSISNGAAYAYGGVDGTVYVSDQRLSAALAAYQVRAVVAGDLIASQPWVTEQIAAIPSSGPTYTLLGTGTLVTSRRQFNFDATEVAAVRAAWDVSTYLELRFVLSAARYVTRQVRCFPSPLPATPIQVYAGITTSGTGAPKILDLTLTADNVSVSAPEDDTWLDGATLEIWGVS